MNIDLSKFKKTGSDKNTTTLKHLKDGHEIRLAHKALKPEMQQALSKLPVHKYAEGTPDGGAGDSSDRSPASFTPDPADYNAKSMPPDPTPTPTVPTDDLSDVTNQTGNQSTEPQAGSAQALTEDEPNGTTPNLAPGDVLQTNKNTTPLGPQNNPNLSPTSSGNDLDQQLAKNNRTMAGIAAERAKSQQNFENLLRSQKVDPNRYWNDKSVPGKIGTALALLFGGIAGRNGGGNPALQILHDNINKDIQAQQNDQSKTMNLYKMHEAQLGNREAAALQTQNNLLTIAKVKAEEQAGQLGGPMADLKNKALQSELNSSIMFNNNKTGAVMAAQNGSSDDPARLVPYLIQDPGERKSAFEEIKNAQNVSANGPKILKAFDNAAQNKHAADVVPGMDNADQMALKQLLLPNFKTIDGTVRQAAMDETYHNTVPAAFDGPDKIAKKRAALIDWLHSESAAPVSRGHGIDLRKFPMTAENMPGISNEGKIANGPNGSIIMKNGKWVPYGR